MSSFCGNCGSQLNKNNNFCPSCGHKVHNDSKKNTEKGEILSLSNSSKKTIVNIVLLILFVMFSVSFYMVEFILSFNWQKVTGIIIDDYEGSSFSFFVLLPIGYIIGVIIISALFKNMKVSKLIVKITFVTSILLIATLTLHLLYIIFLFFGNKNALGIGSSYVYSDPNYQNVIVGVLKTKFYILLSNLIAVAGFITIVLGRYFKNQSMSFVTGFKSLIHKPSISKFIHVFKQLG
ncbi:DNA-directed RNA polymerase subunit RPC12/RpoP [Lederbergia galactosidilyticus]|uniref:zinc-ribbon domain-containing protein n=1 Tax=Lederbergia galactosidilytica TaxID=217031 RepID=UPI001AE802D3|nr:zinc ribbon domain-containing protein [Lederbergia galactosidilytica]MBP1913351.1 DNA-directed RNA polymerase subunit RPC12/RpoP [Lederbergia galactosidilytica]